jgi:hypothetical protein
MIQTAAKNQSKLLDVINELFTYVIDPYTGKQKIRVNPKLTEESLQKSVEKARKLIIQLYVDCELSYVKGIKIYEAIVESKILETTQNQIKVLTKQADKIIKETTTVVKPKAPVAEPLITSYIPEKSNAVPSNAVPLNTNIVPTTAKPIVPVVENDSFVSPLPKVPPPMQAPPMQAPPMQAPPMQAPPMQAPPMQAQINQLPVV